MVMENMTAATLLSEISKPRQNLSAAALRCCGKLFFAALKGLGAAFSDPMTSSAFWPGGIPAMWDGRK